MDNDITLLVIGPNGKTSSGSATIRHFSQSARFTTGLKRGATCFTAAIVSVLIPVLHFVTVPTLLIGAVASFIFTYNREALILKAAAKCPVCEKELKIAKGEPNWPISVSCSECNTQVYVQDAALEPLISISAN